MTTTITLNEREQQVVADAVGSMADNVKDMGPQLADDAERALANVMLQLEANEGDSVAVLRLSTEEAATARKAIMLRMFTLCASDDSTRANRASLQAITSVLG